MLPVDTAWFDANPQKYLSRPEFIRFQEVAGVDFMDLKSSDTEILRRAQERICAQSVIINETRKEHAGYDLPFIAYTHDLAFGDELPKNQKELDKITMAGDMFDSLRRRQIALSHTILPQQISELAQEFKIPLKVANLGSGVGLDLLNVLQGRETILINLTKKHALKSYLALFWKELVLLNETYPEPAKDEIEKLSKIGSPVFHVVGIKAVSMPSFPKDYRGGIPCCAARISENMEVLVKQLN